MHAVRILCVLLPAVQCLELQSRARTAVVLQDPFDGSFVPFKKNATTKRNAAAARAAKSPGRERKAPAYVLATEHADDNLCDPQPHFPIAAVEAQEPNYWWDHYWGRGTYSNMPYGPDQCASACALVDGCAYFAASLTFPGCAIYANCTKASYSPSLTYDDLKIYALAGSTGDPHLRNLAGEKFDVNQPGNYLLLRVPKQPTKPALLELRGAIKTADDAPCGLYLKAVTLSGEWLGGKHLEVRSLKGKSFQGTWPNGWPFAIRTLPTNPKVEGQWKSWENYTSEGNAEDSLPDTVKVTTRFRKEEAAAGRVMEAQAFELHIGSQQAVQERASITVAQGSHEGLDISLARMSSLHEPELGGLLGTDMHDKKVEIRTAECEARARPLPTKRMRMLAGEADGSRFTASWV